MSDEASLYSLDSGVVTITLNCPDAKNVLSADMLGSLVANLVRAIADDWCRVIVLTNAGNTFCGGADLKNTSSQAEAPSLIDIFHLIQGAPKPVIGKIAGHCMGGGVGLAAVCDISIACDDAQIGFTEVRIGVAPAMISVICLPKMRRGDAMELFLSGEKIFATRAAALGLINRSVPRSDLDQEVRALLDKVLLGGPNALAAAKRVVHDVPRLQQDVAFEMTSDLSAKLFRSPEAAQGIRAFREKKPAPWAPQSSASSVDAALPVCPSPAPVHFSFRKLIGKP